MALKDKRSEIIQYVRDNRAYLGRNAELYDIYTGNLLPYVLEILKKTLSENYFKKIESRAIPINILERYIDKISAAYENPPKRIANKEQYQEFVDHYVRHLGLNSKMMAADSYSHLFKGFALEPYWDDTEEKSKLRVMPFDRFIVKSENKNDPTAETIFIKILTKTDADGQKKTCYYTYTNEEFDAFFEDGTTDSSALIENNGMNPYGVIPQTYGKRSENELLPIQSTDIDVMSKLVSVFLSDLSGAALFQCFSIIYGIDIDMENAVMSPNALWSFRSDAATDKQPQIGTIKPEADIDKLLNFIISSFVLWLETKGIRVGSIGSLDAGNLASGISKIIDEMDVYRVVKKSISAFEYDEQVFWHKLVNIHNEWVRQGLVTDVGLIGDDFSVAIIFPEPQPKRERKSIIEEKMLEVNAGFKSKRKAIMELNPDMTEQELELELAEMGGEMTEVFEDGAEEEIG
jgi:hypothetical protein